MKVLSTLDVRDEDNAKRMKIMFGGNIVAPHLIFDGKKFNEKLGDLFNIKHEELENV